MEFSRAIGRKPCPLMRARRRWRRRRAGLGSGSGPSSGSLPGLVLFELGLTGMGYAEHTRSAIRIRTAPPTDPLSGFEPLRQWLLQQLDGQRLRWLGRTVATVQTEPLQLFVGFGPFGPSRSAINSALNSQLKTTQHTNSKKSEGDPLSLSLSLEVTSKQEVGNHSSEFSIENNTTHQQ